MKLTTEHYEVIEKMAGCNYSPANIALYLNLPEKGFLAAWADKKSAIRHHYDRGQLVADFEISRKRLENAMAGNLTADQQHQKETEKRRVEDVKKQILFCGSARRPEPTFLLPEKNA